MANGDKKKVVDPTEITDEFLLHHSKQLYSVFTRIEKEGIGKIKISSLKRGKTFPKHDSISHDGDNYFKVQNPLKLS